MEPFLVVRESFLIQLAATSEFVFIGRANCPEELEARFPDYYATEITVTTKAGEQTTQNDIARGYPEAPLPETELEAKFRALAGSVAAEDRVNRLWNCLSRLHEATKVGELAALLGAPVGD